MNRQDYLAEAKYYGTVALNFVLDHKAVAIAVVAGLVLGFYTRGAFSAPLTCDLTGQALSCTIPNSGTTVPGTGTPPPVTPPVTPSEFAACPAGFLRWDALYPRAAANADTTSGVGALTTGKVLTIRMKVPANASGFKSAYFSGVYGGSRQLTWAISEKACDFDTPVVDPSRSTAKKPYVMKGISSQNIDFNYTYGAGKTLEPGKTYYLNIRIDACNSDNCAFGEIKLP